MPLTFYPATQPQLNFVKSLSSDREVPVAGKDLAEAELIARWEDCFSGKDVTKQEASKVIDWLKGLPKKAPAAAAPQAAPATSVSAEPLTEGIYVTPSEDLVKIKASKAGNLYALVAVDITGQRVTLSGQVVKFDFVYTPGIIKHITPAMRMTQDQAADFGVRHGKCCWCGRTLKAASSVLASLGPVCAKRFA